MRETDCGVATEEEKVEKCGDKIKGFVWNIYAHILIKAIGVSLGVIAEKKRKAYNARI